MMSEAETKSQIRQNRLNELLNTSQKKTYFVSAVTVLFVLLMVLIGILPSYSAFTAQAAQNVRRQEAIDQLEQKRTTIENLVQEQDNKQTLVDKFNTAFPNQYDQISVLSEVDGYVLKDGVNLLNSTFTSVTNTNDIIKKFQVTRQVQAQSVSLLLEGDRDTLTNFISDMENNVTIFDIGSAVITRKVGKELENSDPNKQFKLTLQFNFFFYVQDAK
ncbi:MAG: hypothetical protein ABI721_04480 [Candidatus Dojkabacteria bacterium]